MGSLDYFVLISFFFLLVVIVVTILLSGRKAPEVQGKKEMMRVRCGGRFGRLSAKYPVAVVSLYDGFLVVGHLKKYRIEYDEITDIYEKKHGLSTGIHIAHTAQDVPSIIILWIFAEKQRKRLIEMVESKRKDAEATSGKRINN